MKILDIALKDMVRNFRSVYAIGMMFIVPLLITGLIYAAFGGGGGGGGQAALPATRVVVVNQDTPPANSPDLGGMLVSMLNDPSVAQWLTASSAPSADEALAMVNRQEVGVAVIVPAGFTQSILNGQGKPVVRIVDDPTLTVGPMVVENMIGSLIDGSAGARIAIQADLERRSALNLAADGGTQAYIQAYQDWFTAFQRNLYHTAQAAVISQPPAAQGSQTNDIQRIIGMILSGMAIFFGFETGAFTMQSILKEEEEGTLARIFTTPTDRTAILTGKFLAVVLMVLVQGLAMLAAGALLFKVDWGNPLDAALALLGQVLAATSLGVFLISLIKTQRQAGPVLGGALTVLGMLGGLFTVVVSLPAAFDTVGLFTPQGWVLRAWKLTLNGAAPSELLLPVAVLAAMSVVLFAVGAMRFQRRYA